MGQIIRLPSGRHVLDTGKVRIGLLAKPTVRDIGSQAELIQAALLNPHVKGASGAMDLRSFFDRQTRDVRRVHDDAHRSLAPIRRDRVIYLDNSLMARLLRAVQRLVNRRPS